MRLPDGTVRKLRRSSDDPAAAHALTFSCFRRQPFLSRRRPCLWLVDALEHARRRYVFDLWAYVFMPNHVHLLIGPHGARFQVRSLLSAIKLSVGRRAVAWVSREAPSFLLRMLDVQPNGSTAYRFWQRGGGYDRDLIEPGTIHATIDYIHANPVRASLAEKPDAWPWSSAAYFTGTGAVPLIPDVGSIPTPPKHWRFQSCRV